MDWPFVLNCMMTKMTECWSWIGLFFFVKENVKVFAVQVPSDRVLWYNTVWSQGTFCSCAAILYLVHFYIGHYSLSLSLSKFIFSMLIWVDLHLIGLMMRKDSNDWTYGKRVCWVCSLLLIYGISWSSTIVAFWFRICDFLPIVVSLALL